jgi:dihydroorotate dehydrogenase (NAD+) catalytic subunit
MPATGAPRDMRVTLAPRLILNSPVIAASGGFGYGDELPDLADAASLGALVTPTLTLKPRDGNPMPRTAETHAGLLHSLGLPNPGLDRFLSERLTRLRSLPCPVIVSIRGETAGEWRALATALSASGGLSALELNLGTLSLDGEAAILRGIARAVAAVRKTADLPLIAKLPAANVEIGAVARAAAEAGADAIAVSQGFPGVAVRMSSRAFRLPGIAGELSGPAIKPLALYQVWRVAQAVELPIVGSGGVMTAEDALEFFVAGASAVAVGIASCIHPTAIARIGAGVAAYLAEHGLSSTADIAGAALAKR